MIQILFSGYLCLLLLRKEVSACGRGASFGGGTPSIPEGLVVDEEDTNTKPSSKSASRELPEIEDLGEGEGKRSFVIPFPLVNAVN